MVMALRSLALFAVFLPSLAAPQTGGTHATLQVMMVRAAAVVVAHVESTTNVRAATQNEYGESLVKLDIDETLKGDERKTIELVVNTNPLDVFQGWRDEKTSILVFLSSPSDRVVEGAYSVERLGNGVPAERRYTNLAPKLYSDDFTILHNGEEILKAARAFGKISKKSTFESIKFAIPGSFCREGAPRFDFNQLEVLVTDQSRRAARKLIQHPDQFLDEDHTKADEDMMKAAGKELLKHKRTRSPGVKTPDKKPLA